MISRFFWGGALCFRFRRFHSARHFRMESMRAPRLLPPPPGSIYLHCPRISAVIAATAVTVSWSTAFIQFQTVNCRPVFRSCGHCNVLTRPTQCTLNLNWATCASTCPPVIPSVFAFNQFLPILFREISSLFLPFSTSSFFSFFSPILIPQSNIYIL